MPDARAVVYAGIQAEPVVARAGELLAEATSQQRLLARAVMTGETDDPAIWRTMFPGLFRGSGDDAAGDDNAGDGAARARSEAILATSLEVAARGDRVRDQVRGAVVEAVTERLLARRVAGTSIRRERRILFDGVPAEIHPYDVTVETPGATEAYDCKWGARGIKADVLHQLDDARSHAADEEEALRVALVVFDAERSCRIRLSRETAPAARTGLVTIESMDQIATGVSFAPASTEPAS